MECAAIHDILIAIVAIETDSLLQGKKQLNRIVAMLTKLIRRTRSNGKWSAADEDYCEDLKGDESRNPH